MVTTYTSAPAPSSDALEKESALRAWLRHAGSVLIGFSGGVDSTYLAVVAHQELGSANTLAAIGRSASYPAEQWQAARSVAQRFSIPVHEVDTHEMQDERYVANPTNRCYFCKTELWGVLTAIAVDRGLSTTVDGTNADDLLDYRPGARAAAEHNVHSPLALVGLTKAAIRALSSRLDIPTWAQPSSPCLSSRIPYHTAVTPARLRQVELAERGLRSLGIVGDLRVRHHGNMARVELSKQELTMWLAPDRAPHLASAVRAAGFERVVIDLKGFRSGSLNVLSGVVAE